MGLFFDKLLLMAGKRTTVTAAEPDVELTPTILKPTRPMSIPVAPAAAVAPVVAPVVRPVAAPTKPSHPADKPTLDRISKAHPKVREELLKMYYEILAALTGKSTCRFAYVMRTFSEQADLYAQGRTTAGKIVTNAPAGLSIHQYGLAFDIVLLVDKDGNGTYESASWDTVTDFDGDGIADWMEIVSIAKKYGWSWGGDWTSIKDLPHFEKTFGHKPSDLLTKYKAGALDINGYVNV